MPTNRVRKMRNKKEEIQLNDSVRDLLLYGKTEKGTPGHDLRTSRFFDDGLKLRQTWLTHEETLMQEWRQRKHRGQPWVVAWLQGKR
jgi:hypothetical protein